MRCEHAVASAVEVGGVSGSLLRVAKPIHTQSN